MSRPLIAVAGRIAAAGRVSRSAISFAGRVYLEAVIRAGGEPVTLSPRELRHEDALELLSRFDGLVLMPHVYGVIPEQDHFEAALVHAAVEAKVPTLAVCRGIQLVNVTLGGTLIQHIGEIEGVVQHAPDKFPAGQDFVLHDVEIDKGSKLASAMRVTTARVASFHHQGLDEIAKGLKVTARSDDGLVEGLEHTGSGQWLIGVQWHPEDTAATDPHQQRLYDTLVQRAVKRRERR